MRINKCSFLIVLIITTIVASEIRKQSNFRYGTKCIEQVQSHTFHNIPYVNVNTIRDLMNNKKKQKGSKVQGFRLSDHELCTLFPELMQMVKGPSFMQTMNQLLGFVPEKINIFGRIYSKGDKIDWHYDQNYTKKQRITGILHIETPECNTSFLQVRDPCSNKEIHPFATKGTLLLYDGSNIYHRVTEQLQDNCFRFVVIFAIYESKAQTFGQKIYEKGQNLASRFIDF